MSFDWPLALVGLLVLPIPVVLYVLADRPAGRSRGSVRLTGAPPEPRAEEPGRAAARAVRALPRRAGAPPRRCGAPPRERERPARGGNGRARARHLALDGCARRSADEARGRARRRRGFLAARPVALPRRRRLVRLARDAGSPPTTWTATSRAPRSDPSVPVSEPSSATESTLRFGSAGGHALRTEPCRRRRCW